MREFGHKRPVRGPEGEIVDMIESPVAALTREALGGQFGSDKRRKLIVTLEAGDLIVIRPQGTRRAEKMSAVDVYRYMIRCKANLISLTKARERKERKSVRLAAARIARADKRIREQSRKENKS